jgi:hypothetical protein
MKPNKDRPAVGRLIALGSKDTNIGLRKVEVPDGSDLSRGRSSWDSGAFTDLRIPRKLFRRNVIQ